MKIDREEIKKIAKNRFETIPADHIFILVLGFTVYIPGIFKYTIGVIHKYNDITNCFGIRPYL